MLLEKFRLDPIRFCHRADIGTKHEDDPAAAADDALSRDLAALMAYGREDMTDEI